MGGQQVSVGAKDETCVVVFLCIGKILGNTATDQVGLGLFGQSRQSVECGRLRLGGRRWLQGLCVFGEVLCAIRRVEALGQNDDIGALAGGFEDL